MDTDPYEAPHARLAVDPDDVVAVEVDAVQIRLAHLHREAGLRAVGVACLVFAAWLLLLGVEMGAIATRDYGGFTEGIIFAVSTSLGLLALAAAWGYFRLRPWVRLPGGILALATLFASVFIAAPIVGYAAWLTYSAKGLRVLSRDYAAIRAATPQLRAWRRPGEALVLLGVLGLYLAAFAVITANLPAD
jgi:hypothetical protein